jgi:acyl carrier protein
VRRLSRLALPMTNPPFEAGTPAEQMPFELELARLVVKAVNLDVRPEEIDPVAPLFQEGLGLDSIDLLEIALVVSQEYGVTLRSDDPDNDRIFASMRNLAAHVSAHREK